MIFRFAIFWLAAVILLAGCSDDNGANPTDKETEQKLRTIIDSNVTNSHRTGLVAGIWAPDENISLVYATGYSDMENMTPMEEDLLFRIGSNTKTMTVTVLLQLVDEGRIALDDKLSEYRPDLPKADQITIEMLTDMTSGYHNYSEINEFLSNMMSNPTKVWQPEECIQLAMDEPMYFEPGEGWYYSNTNTFILGTIIEDLTGKTLRENIEQRIFDPFGLDDSYFPESGTDFPRDDFYHGYYMDGYDPENPDYSEYFDISWAWAAGATISTLYDLKTYVETLVGGGFISDSLQQKRLVCKNEIKPQVSYGIGMFDMWGFHGHNGGLPGYNSIMVHDPDRNCTIILLQNCYLEDNKVDKVFAVLAEAIYPDMDIE